MTRIVCVAITPVVNSHLSQNDNMTILVPSVGPEYWRKLLQSDEQWRTGFSARTLAHAWSESTGFPREVQLALSSLSSFKRLELLLAIPEHQVQLPGRGKASHTDLWALAKADDGLVSIAVEGKVNEPFGPTIDEWLIEASENKRTRLDGLCALLQLKEIPGNIRYQLLHRTASAIIEARRFAAKHAVMLVHSFSPDDAWYDDFEQFTRLMGAAAKKNVVSTCAGPRDPIVHVAWVRGDQRFLRM